MDEILTPQEIASFLKVDERTVQAMITDRELPAFRLRDEWRIRRTAFTRWLDSLTDEVADPPSEPELIVERSSEKHLAASSTGDDADAAQEAGDRRRLPGALTEKVSQRELHKRFVEALGDGVRVSSPLDSKILELDLSPPLPSRLRVYIYNATRPPGGRPTGEHKIQPILPGQARGERASFDHGDGRVVILAGYSVEEDVFIIWDAGLYPDLGYSRNVQVKAETIIRAHAGKLATQERYLRQPGGEKSVETVIAVRSEQLGEALQHRVSLTRERMIKD